MFNSKLTRGATTPIRAVIIIYKFIVVSLIIFKEGWSEGLQEFIEPHKTTKLDKLNKIS